MEKLYRLSHEIQFKNTIFTIILAYQRLLKTKANVCFFLRKKQAKVR